MKKSAIVPGRSYLNKSGRSERKVLDVGPHVAVDWCGDDATEPKGEPGVQYIDRRMGKTIYGPGSGKRAQTMYLSTFASWASQIVPEGQEA
ncbi:hypothetical protein [Sphingomonas sp. Leaf10]|uniref:hypothetical protein n=1 Tax=Sphingomonas sp. Leaf10 TaxID=1735676 RepID=UPI0006FC9F8F|nr:hypothetical protein [Sphingomonas sp. Leaf10]KQM37919.1 hypothetical protein ASE59_11505 [Sphingomonas sp. Leaf10]